MTLAADVAGVIRHSGAAAAVVVGQGGAGTSAGRPRRATRTACRRCAASRAASDRAAAATRPGCARAPSVHVLAMQVPWLPERTDLPGGYVARHLERWSSPLVRVPVRGRGRRTTGGVRGLAVPALRAGVPPLARAVAAARRRSRVQPADATGARPARAADRRAPTTRRSAVTAVRRSARHVSGDSSRTGRRDRGRRALPPRGAAGDLHRTLLVVARAASYVEQLTLRQAAQSPVSTARVGAGSRPWQRRPPGRR